MLDACYIELPQVDVQPHSHSVLELVNAVDVSAEVLEPLEVYGPRALPRAQRLSQMDLKQTLLHWG